MKTSNYIFFKKKNMNMSRWRDRLDFEACDHMEQFLSLGILII